MANADSSDLQFAFIEEATFGVTPDTPVFQMLKITGESLEYGIENTQSNIITPNADVSDLVQVGASATGGFNTELYYGPEVNTLLSHALRGTFDGGRLNAGTAKRSMTFEKRFEIGDPDEWHDFNGFRIGQMNATVQAGGIITLGVSGMGLGGTRRQAVIADATYADAAANGSMTAVDVANITVDGTATEIQFTNLSFAINNNLRAQRAVSSLPSTGIGYGQRAITLSVDAYFSGESAYLYADYIAGAETSFSFGCSDGENTYGFNFPRLKQITHRVLAEGNNNDVLARMTMQALFDAGEGTSMFVTNG